MIKLWHDEIHEIDKEIDELILRDPHLGKYRYPEWLREDMEEFEQRYLANK